MKAQFDIQECFVQDGMDSQKGGGTIDVFDDAEYSGSLISLIENGEGFIKRNAKMMWRKTPNSREEFPEYVECSYHEALVNAIAHRDYLVNGSEVHIDIYDDCMEIYSPGGMPDGSIIQNRDLKTVPSTRRNPVIADVFNRLGYMERKGSGFAKILDNYAIQLNYTESKKPYFRSNRYQFTVIMPNLNYGNIQNDTVNDSVVSLMLDNSNITISNISSILGLSRSIVTRKIKKLREEGIIERVGSDKAGVWKIIKH